MPCALATARILGANALRNGLYRTETEQIHSSVSQEETGAN